MNIKDDWKAQLDKYYKERLRKLLHYSKKKHLELLEQETNQSNEELISYAIILIGQLNWEIRGQYFKLVKEYVEEKIDSGTFRIGFLERFDSIDEVADFLISNRIFLSPDQQSIEFARLLGEIDDACELYSGEPIEIRKEFKREYELGDIEFQASIEKIYLKMQNLVSEE